MAYLWVLDLKNSGNGSQQALPSFVFHQPPYYTYVYSKRAAREAARPNFRQPHTPNGVPTPMSHVCRHTGRHEQRKRVGDIASLFRAWDRRYRPKRDPINHRPSKRQIQKIVRVSVELISFFFPIFQCSERAAPRWS